MGGKSIAHRAASIKQRQRIRDMSMRELMESKANSHKGEITTKEVVCEHCGFKAYYKFIKCPECGHIRTQG